MNKILIIAEKARIADEIASAFGIKSKNKNRNYENDSIIIGNLSGHILTKDYEKTAWNIKTLPLDLNKYKIKVISSKKTTAQSIFAELERKDIGEIVSAGDADREGSYLIYEVLAYKKVLNTKITRIWLTATDKETIKEAFANRYSIEKDLPFVVAGEAREEVDAMYGFNLTRLFTLKKGDGTLFSIGRVRTAAMQIVRYREDEIKNFVVENYNTIKGFFSQNVIADYLNLNDENKLVTKIVKENFEKTKQDIENGNKEYKVSSITKENKKVYPKGLPNQNEILVAISKMDKKINSKNVSEALQNLYLNQFISYPRSEIKYLKTSLYERLLPVFKSLLENYKNQIGNEDVNFSTQNKKCFNDEEVVEHFAVIPYSQKSKQDIENLNYVEKKVYDYVVMRFLTAFMNPYEYESTIIELNNGKSLFKVVGKIEIKKGFKSYDSSNDEKDTILPDLHEGDTLILNKIETKEEQTKPPQRIDESSLLAIMEDVSKLFLKKIDIENEDFYENEYKGSKKLPLGTSATRADIIQDIIKLKYFSRDKNAILELTAIGNEIVDNVSNFVDLKTTALFDIELQKIIKDKNYKSTFIDNSQKYINEIIEKIVPTIKNKELQMNTETDIGCPLCENKIVSNDKMYKCSTQKYVDGKTEGCKFTLWKDNKYLNLTFTDELLEEFLTSTKEKPFLNKVYFDADDKYFMKNIQGYKAANVIENTTCPLCKSPLVMTDKIFKCSMQKYVDGKTEGCKFFIFRDQTKAIGKVLDEVDLEKVLQTTESSPFKGNTNNSIYLDLNNKYFISTNWNKT